MRRSEADLYLGTAHGTYGTIVSYKSFAIRKAHTVPGHEYEYYIKLKNRPNVVTKLTIFNYIPHGEYYGGGINMNEGQSIDSVFCGTFTATADTTYFIVKDAAGIEGNVLVLKSFTLTNFTKNPPCYDTLSTSQTGYAYRYNGQKTNPEIAYGHQTALYWEHDSRTGRRWNLDPVRQYFLSQYATFGGNPVNNVDPNGDYFFGLIGSTAQQRRTARDYAAATGGYVENTTSKNISVKWWTNEDGGKGTNTYIHTTKFLRDGGIDYGSPSFNSTMKSNYEADLKVGDYNIYTGYTKGSGEVESPVLDPIDFVAGGLTGALRGSTTSGVVNSGHVFWSGGDFAKNTAAEFAKANGLRTLEMTMTGRIMNSVSPFVPRSISNPIWKNMSKRFASSTSSNAHFFTTSSGPRATSIWLNVEKPILEKNGVNIITHQP